VRSVSTTIESLEVEIQSNSTSAANGVDALASSLVKLKNATKGGSGLTSMSNQLTKLDNILKGVSDSSADKVGKLTNSLSAFSAVGNLKISSTIATQINKINEAMNNISVSGVEKLEKTAGAVGQMSGLGNVHFPTASNLGTRSPSPSFLDDSASSVTTGSQAVAGAVDEMTRYTDQAQKASAETGRLGDKLKQAGTKLKEVIGGKTQAGFSKNTRGMRLFGNATKESVSKLEQFFISLQRIAMYRAVRFILSSLVAAMKEGIDNLYQYSRAFDGVFAQSLDRCATSFQYLKNSMAAMVSPLINALSPAIDFIIDKFVALLNIVNQLFARLSGASTWTKAKKQATEYGGAVSGVGSAATKAAKEIRDATLGIDELNIISPNDDSGSGGGSGGGGGANYGDMFEEVPITQNISDFADKLKAAFEAADWKQLGTILGQKINDIVNGINWEGIGQKIGFYLNGAIQTAYWFLKTVDFINIGSRIASMINSALSEIDGEFVGRLIIRWFTKGFDFFIGFVTTLDWGQVGKFISDAIIGIFNEMADWFESIDWPRLNREIWEKIKDFFTNIDWKGIVDSIVRVFTTVFEDGFNPLGLVFLGILTSTIINAISGFVSFIGGGIGKLFSGFGKIAGLFSKSGSGGGATGGFNVPSPKTVLKGLADLALIIFGVIGIIEAVGLLMKIPGFEEVAKSGIKALGTVFGGLMDVIIPLTAMSLGIIGLGKIGIPTVAKGLVNMAIIVDGIPIVITAIGALISIPYFSGFLSTGIKSVQEVFKGLGEVALPIGILSGILIGLGLATPALIISGLAGFALVIGGLSLVLVALGALNQIPGFSWIVGEGGKVLMQLGEILGGFVGSIVKGLLEKMSSSFPTIGQHLSDFMTNATPFFKGLDNVNADSIDAVKKLAETVMILTAASVLDGLTSWITGGSDMVTFGKQLSEFAPYFNKYYEKIKGIDGGVVEASANAALALAEMSSKLPKTGGVAQFFAGEVDMAAFGDQLVVFGRSMVRYGDVVKGLDSDVITASATAAKSLVEVANELPKIGGVAQFFAGSKDMGVFGEQLVLFGKGMKSYYEQIKSVKPDTITASANAAKSLVEIANELPRIGGVAQFFAGSKDMGVFGDQLVLFGKGMYSYYMQIKNTKPEVITASANSAKALVEIANELPRIGGVAQFFAGTKDIGAFGDQLTLFGKGMKTYYEHIKMVKPEVVTASANAAQSMMELVKMVPSQGGLVSLFTGNQSIAVFGVELAAFGQHFGTYYSHVSKVDGSKVSRVSVEMEKILAWAENVAKADTKEMKTFGETLKTLGSDFATFAGNIVTGFTDKISSAYSTSKSSIVSWGKGVKDWFTSTSYGGVNKQNFNIYATDIINGFKDKVSSTYSTTKSSITTWATNVKDWFAKTGYGAVNKETFGKYATDIINGFKDKVASSYTTSQSAIVTWAKKISEWFETNLNKAKFGQLALDIVNAFKNGIEQNYSSAKTSMTNFGKSVIDAFSAKVSYNIFYQIGKDVVSGFDGGLGAMMNASITTVNNWSASLIKTMKDKLGIHSPSWVFGDMAEFSVLGFNNKIVSFGKTTKNVIGKWVDSFVNVTPLMELAVDTSALKYYDTSSFAKTITSKVSANTSVSADGFKDAMEEFYHNHLAQMADDVRRQADKDEHPVVQVGNRVITDAVTTQQKANGFQFVKA